MPKNNIRRKAQLGLDIREGGIAIPIAPNMYYMNGRSHNEGGIAIGPNNKNGLEVEGGEVIKVGDRDIKVFSSVPLLRGVSPAQLVMGGANPNKVFKAQEDFKDRNHINDDGTTYENGGKIAIEGVKTIGGYLPFVGTALDAYKLYKNPSWKQAGWTALGLLTDIFTAGSARAVMKTARNLKNAKEALSIVRGPITKRIYKDAAIDAIKANTKAKKDVIQDATLNVGQNYVQYITDKYEIGGEKKFNSTIRTKDDTKTAALKRFRNRFTVAGDYGSGLFGGAGAGSVIMEQPEYVNDTITKRYLVPVTQTFNDAFRNARNSGQNEFMFDGKLYNTNLGDNPNNNTAGANRTSTIIIPIEHKEVRRRKKEFGGNMIYEINGNIKNGLMSARPKAKLGKTVKINRGSYETVDEAVERYKQLYRIRYGKEPSKNDIERVAWTKSLENAVNNDNPNLITGYGPNVGLRAPNVSKIVSNANKGKQIARTQTTVRNKNIKSTSPKRQAVDTKVSEAARLERQSQFDAWQQGEAFKSSTMPTDAVAVNRPTIGTGVRSGRKGRVDDVVAIERSQRSVDPLASKPEGSIYDKQYAKRYQNKTFQTANILAGTGAAGVSGGYILSGGSFNDEENNLNDENKQNTKPFNITNNNSSVSNKPNYTINGTFDNARPQFYAEKRLPIAGSQSIAEKAGLARSGWSYADNEPITFNYVPNINLNIPDNYGKGSTPRRGETKPTSSKPTTKSQPTIQDTINQITRDAISRSITPKIDLSKVEMPKFDVSQLGSKETKAAKDKLNTSSTGDSTKPKDERLIPQFKPINIDDWIGLGSNLAGHIVSYFANNNLLKKYPMPTKPIMAPAAKLKTRYNINPELSETRETELVNRSAVRRNSQSSNTSLAREQRIINEARNVRNQLYGQKENIETQLINQDRLNRQTIAGRNVAAYNDWLDKTYVAKSNRMLTKQQNLMSLINGIPAAVNNIIGNIESRRNTNNTIKAIAAANPNVDGRLLGIGDYYSQRLSDGRVAIYDKNGKLKRIK